MTAILKSTRLWGLVATAAVLYFLAFGVLGRLDMSWIMPDTNQIARTMIEVWPRMPFFAVQREPVHGDPGKTGSASQDQGEMVYFTVPTRQFTPQELARMGVTNAVAHPAAPK
jgi:hypothetical protein